MVVRQALGITSEHDEEAQLIARAQESDRAAWDEIFQRHYQRIYVFVFCRIGDAMAAEDVTADVFVEAWKGIRRYSYRGVPLISWLFRIAHNLIANFLRRHNRAAARLLFLVARNAGIRCRVRQRASADGAKALSVRACGGCRLTWPRPPIDSRSHGGQSDPLGP